LELRITLVVDYLHAQGGVLHHRAVHVPPGEVGGLGHGEELAAVVDEGEPELREDLGVLDLVPAVAPITQLGAKTGVLEAPAFEKTLN
jgi:hypothetical protein